LDRAISNIKLQLEPNLGFNNCENMKNKNIVIEMARTANGPDFGLAAAVEREGR